MQPLAQLIGTSIQLTIGKLFIVTSDGDGIWRDLNLTLKELVHTRISRNLTIFCSIPLTQEHSLLGLRKNSVVTHTPVGSSDDLFQQVFKVRDQTRDTRLVKEIRTVNNHAAQAFGQLPQVQLEIESRRAYVKLFGAQSQSRQLRVRHW